MSTAAQPVPSLADSRGPTRAQPVSTYVSTTLVMGLNILATVGVSSILSRTWSRADFLLFTTVNRYLSLLYCIVSMSLGFGIVKLHRTAGAQEEDQVLSNALLIVGAFAIGVIALLQLCSQEVIAFFGSQSIAARWTLLAGGIWVAGQSAYHVVLSYERSLGRTADANWLMFIVKTLLVLALSIAAWATQSISIAAYYGWVGTAILAVLLVYLWRLRSSWGFSADTAVCRKLISISWSRCLESVLKHALMPIVVTLLYVFDQPETAGSIVVVAMLLRGVESLFQPLVLIVMADSLNTASDPKARNHRVQASWDCILCVSLPATFCLILVAEPLLHAWLGSSYRSLAGSFQILSLSLPAVLATVLLRGNLESQYRTSPLALTCLFRIAAACAAIPLLAYGQALDLRNIAILLTALYWTQWVVIFALLRREFGTRIFSTAFYRYCRGRLRHGGRQR